MSANEFIPRVSASRAYPNQEKRRHKCCVCCGYANGFKHYFFSFSDLFCQHRHASVAVFCNFMISYIYELRMNNGKFRQNDEIGLSH